MVKTAEAVVPNGFSSSNDYVCSIATAILKISEERKELYNEIY